MFRRKPKDINKFLVGISAAQALHTWQYSDDARLKQMGSAAQLSMQQRKQREANRKVVGQYHTSKIATVATTMRGDVARFTKEQRAKREERFNSSLKDTSSERPPSGPAPDRPTPDASLYRRPSI